MQLIIKKNKCNKSFVKGYLKLFLVASLRTEYDNERIATLDTYYDIDCKKVLEYLNENNPKLIKLRGNLNESNSSN